MAFIDLLLLLKAKVIFLFYKDYKTYLRKKSFKLIKKLLRFFRQKNTKISTVEDNFFSKMIKINVRIDVRSELWWF